MWIVESLEIPVAKFTAANLNATFDLGRQFDLVQSLEVGEHIEKRHPIFWLIVSHDMRAATYCSPRPLLAKEANIISMSNRMSSGGQNLRNASFATVDTVRPAIANDHGISFWYRYNTLLFIRRELLPEIGENLQHKVLHPNNGSRIYPLFLFASEKPS